MGLSILVQYDQLRSVVAGAGTLDGTWREIIQLGGAAGSGVFTHNMRLVKIQNITNMDVYISFNLGVNTHDIIPAGGFTLYDLTTNRSNNGGDFIIGKGIFVFAKTVGGAAATGSYLTVTCIFGKGE